jgi:hypothetical protein
MHWCDAPDRTEEPIMRTLLLSALVGLLALSVLEIAPAAVQSRHRDRMTQAAAP